jgi:hypothetical protein
VVFIDKMKLKKKKLENSILADIGILQKLAKNNELAHVKLTSGSQ